MDILKRKLKKWQTYKSINNRELAGTALDCLHELKRRGNKSLDGAIETVTLFHNNLSILQQMAEALENCLEFEDEHLN